MKHLYLHEGLSESIVLTRQAYFIAHNFDLIILGRGWVGVRGGI